MSAILTITFNPHRRTTAAIPAHRYRKQSDKDQGRRQHRNPRRHRRYKPPTEKYREQDQRPGGRPGHRQLPVYPPNVKMIFFRGGSSPIRAISTEIESRKMRRIFGTRTGNLFASHEGSYLRLYRAINCPNPMIWPLIASSRSAAVCRDISRRESSA
jgi:hypothetical protein